MLVVKTILVARSILTKAKKTNITVAVKEARQTYKY